MSNIVPIDGKFYDFGTKNSSFLLTAQELKTLGIKNWYFMLEVKYPNLGVQDIDPFNPDIKPEDIGRIHMECKANIWFWLREVARIPAKGAPQPYQVYLTRASCAATWCFDHNIDFMLNQPRQTYKTTIIELLTVHAFIYDLKNVDIPFMHIYQKDTLRNAEMFRDYISALPNYMNPWSRRSKPPGLESLKYDEHGTKIYILSAADSEIKAKDKMRGMTIFVRFFDEWEYTPYIDSVISGSTPAVLSGRAIAKQTGGKTCSMMASTPGDLETPTGKAAQRMIDLTPPFSEKFYDLTDNEIDNMFAGMNQIDDDGSEVPVTMLYIEYNYIQLRKNKKWLNEQFQEANRTGKLAEYRRGVLLDRFRGSNTVLFDQKNIDYLIEHVREPDYEMLVINKYVMYVYKHDIRVPDINSDTPYFDMSIPYLIGIDVASGSDGDNTAICIVHPYTLQIVAELQSPYMGLLDLMYTITYLARILPRALFCLETNNVGKAIVDFVQKSSLESRFYYDPQLDLAKNATTGSTDTTSVLQKKAREKHYIGTEVTPKKRNDMFDLLKRHVKEYRHLLISKYLVKDILNLIIHKNGKIAADFGEHDDMVMAYLHTLYVLYYGANVERFGIDKTLCTYEKAYGIIAEYTQSIEENTIDNMVPYDQPTIYEDQLLHDMINTTVFNQENNTDAYGYNQNQYNQRGMQKNEDVGLSGADYAFFNSVNSFY